MTKLSRVMLAALAVCGTTAAMAQSSVTVYGRVNTTVEHTKSGKDSVTGLNNNASRLGFRGVEDLGNGLKAGFVMEGGFNSDDGTGRTNGAFAFDRESELNLSGNFGMVRMGKFTPESYLATADYISMHNHDTGLSADVLYTYVMRDSNKIAYRAPAFGGFTVEAAYSFHEKVNKGLPTEEKNAYDLAANYNNGPLGLGAGYSRNGKNWQSTIRGSYSFGSFVVGAYYQRTKDEGLAGVKDPVTGNTTAGGNRNNFRLSGMYVLNASEFHVNVGRANSWSKVDDTAATQWTLGYNYNLSKRTKVYTYYTKTNHGKNINYYGNTEGDNLSSFALGIRHNF